MSIRQKQACRQKEAPVNSKAEGSLRGHSPEEDQAGATAAPCGCRSPYAAAWAEHHLCIAGRRMNQCDQFRKVFVIFL